MKVEIYGGFIWLVKYSPQPIRLQAVEVDRFTNEISRVRYNRTWLNATGRQSTRGLITAGMIGLLVALICLGMNVPYLLSRTRGRSKLRFAAAT